MYQGLPLTVLAGGEHGDEPEMVTAVFTLSLREPSRDEGPDASSLSDPSSSPGTSTFSASSARKNNAAPPVLPPRPQSTPQSSRSVTSAVPLAAPAMDESSLENTAGEL